MTKEASHIEGTNGSTRSYIKNKVEIGTKTHLQQYSLKPQEI